MNAIRPELPGTVVGSYLYSATPKNILCGIIGKIQKSRRTTQSNYTLAGVELGENATVRLDADNEPQPDALWRIDAGGRSQIRDDDYVRSPLVQSSHCLVFGVRGDRSFFTQASLSVQSSDCLVFGVRGDRSLWVMGRSLLGQSSHWNGRNG